MHLFSRSLLAGPLLMLLIAFLPAPTVAEDGDPRQEGLVSTWTSAPFIPRAMAAPGEIFRAPTVVGPVVTFPARNAGPLALYLNSGLLRQMRLARLQAEASARINFAFDSTTLDDEAMLAISALSILLIENPDIGLTLGGHTDLVGDDDYNDALGTRRAEEVRDALIDFGVEPERLRVVSHGEGLPLHFTLKPTRINRRVNSEMQDLFLIEPIVPVIEVEEVSAEDE